MGVGKAEARPATPDSLVSVQNAVKATHHWQRLSGHCCKRYWWVAHRHDTPTWKRWHIAAIWWGNAEQAHQRYLEERPLAPSTASVPGWFVEAASCISDHEEYGYDGGSTVAGYFGFIYPPGSYGPVDQALVMTYGTSWVTWPLTAQLQVAYWLYNQYGWSPWSTAPGCGLA